MTTPDDSEAPAQEHGRLVAQADGATPSAGPGGTRPGASFAATVLTGLASAGLAVVATNAVWAVRESSSPAPPVELAGSDLVPLVVPLTLVSLACWGAVLVLRRRGRRVVAALGAGSALAAAASTVTGLPDSDDLDPTGWPWVVLAAATVTALALARAWVAAPGWPEMSSRYDRRAGPARDAERAQDEAREGRAQEPAELWRALDEGRDPTA